MKHTDWLTQVKPLLPGSKSDPIEAARRLRAIADRTRRHLKTDVTAWHQEQALGLAATRLALAGQHASAAKQYEALTRSLMPSLIYYLRASISNTELSVSSYVASGHTAKAERLQAKQAALERALSEVLRATHPGRTRRRKPAV